LSFLLSFVLQKFARQAVEDEDLSARIWTPDHADLADRAAGDDESPEQASAPAAGGHGDAPLSPQADEEVESAPAPPLRVVPISVRPTAASASAPKTSLKRSTAHLEAALKKKRRMAGKPIPEVAG
jgi:hypothetical protein